MTWYDLSMPIKTNMPVYPGDPPVEIRRIMNLEQDGLQVSQLVMTCHAGTHIDAPRHFCTGGKSVDQLPLMAACGNALIVSVPLSPGHRVELHRADLTNLQPGDGLILATGWERRAGTASFFDDMPVFVPGSSDLLLGLDLPFLGMDLPTVIEAADPPDPAAMHQRLLGSGMVLIEGLVGLQELAGRRVALMALPLKLIDCDGSPVRACARILSD